ncbi:pleckstrin homology domain-containing family G member 2 isoform X2 [Oryzias latipes]|uniref:pleckstrin homology domain-containing family G member 2 isoform X2 n=1 Tax=Oryzias latipes TaxID=8090 RepID=UPI000CE20E6B|nr:pleckstrin homology domain-containing family G member 2 isoform X2 [Oryzias latipes]
MPEGSRRGSHKLPSSTAAKRPSSVSSLSGIVGRMMSSGDRGPSSSSCTSVNTVCSDSERPASLVLSSSTSSVSLQDASHSSSSSSSSSSSLPYGAVPTYNVSSSSSSSSTPKRNGSDISLDLTPLVTPHGAGVPGGGGAGVTTVTGESQAPNGHAASPAVAMAAPSPRPLSRLERVILEIVETEQAYVRDLKSIVEDYLGCIIDCGALGLKPEQVSSLFCNIEDIYEFNSDLLEDLERRPDAAAIAECFVERNESFDIYTLYCMNYPNSVAVLKECMKNETLVRFFQERQTTLNHSLPLETYLLKPVQRILKYHLLLQELSKHFDKNDPGYEVVEDAIVTMTAVAWYINDMKRKQEHAVRLQEIESLLVNWTGPNLSGFGELVLEGSFKVQRVKKERAFFLFDKMLLITKKRLEQFVYSTHIFCCHLMLVEALKDPLCFKVSDRTIPKQQHVVQAKNQEEKRLWVYYLKRLIVENHPASLPQKARQVLGDSFCQTPQFNQDHLKNSRTSPRPDDFHGYHRGRRQSEPQELLLYTPEKSRKSLPLLLEGNLPCRRTRRQSAPAKDIEAAFQSNALKAGSEGELHHTDSLGSAGSSSTLASSVIEVEPDKEEQGQLAGSHQGEENEDEEDFSPLSPPPTLSITEEILEFINQSRAREGLAAIPCSSAKPSEDEPQSDQTNFTCPLPPVAFCTEQRLDPSRQQEASETETKNRPMEDEKDTAEVQDSSGLSAQTETRRTEGEAPEGEEGGESHGDPPTTSNLLPFSGVDSKTQIISSKEEVSVEASTPQSLDLLHPPMQTCLPPKRGSNASKKDKRIIEKIRNYYETAAEADEEDAMEEEEMTEGLSRRRNSFTQIPSGLVKESVSRFSTGGQQGEPESRPLYHFSPASLPPHAESHEELEKPAISEDPPEAEVFDGTQEEEIQTQTDQNQPSSPDREETEIQDQSGLNRSTEKRDEGTSGVEGKTNIKTEKEESLCVSTQNHGEGQNHLQYQDLTDKHESSKTEPNQDQTEPTLTVSCQNNDNLKAQSLGTKAREPTNPSNSPEGRIKVGRWSRHSRIVTANRALFEGMASDVTGIGLFEVNPVADPVLIENSERILNKVQTLARMYSAKASTMKVPLHQKRGSSVQNQSWVSARLSGPPLQNQNPRQTEPIDMDRSDSTPGVWTISETKVDHEEITPEPTDQSRPALVRTHTPDQSQPEVQENPEIHQKMKPPESQTDDSLSALEPPPATHSTRAQTNADRLSAGTKDRVCGVSCSSAEDLQTSTTAGEPPSSLMSPQCLTSSQTESTFQLRDPPEGQGSRCSTGNRTSPAGLDHRSPEFRDYSAAAARPLVDPGPQKNGGLENDDGQLIYPIKESWISGNILTQPTHTDWSSSASITPHPPAKEEANESLKGDLAAVRQDKKIPDSAGSSSAGDPSGGPETEKSVQNLQPAEDRSAQLRRAEIRELLHPPSPVTSDPSQPKPHWLKATETVRDSDEPDEAPSPWAAIGTSDSIQPRPPSVDCLPTFTSQRPTDLPTTLSRRASSDRWSAADSDHRRTPDRSSGSPFSPQTSNPLGRCSETAASPNPSAFKSNLPQHSSSSSSVRAPPCSSPFRGLSASSPTPRALVGTTSKALSCLSPPPSPSVRSPPPSYSSSARSPSSTSFLSPTPSSPISAFTRSLAASCISQSISQSMAKTGSSLQEAPPITQSPSSTPHLRRRSPSPRLPPSQRGTSTPWFTPLGSRDEAGSSLQPPCPPLSPSPCRRSPSPSSSLVYPQRLGSSPSPRPSFLHPQSDSSNNNNNNMVGCYSPKASLSNGVFGAAAAASPTHNPPPSPSFNRVARPFSASEPSSRVPSPSPCPVSFHRLCSPPPQHNYSSPLANKPPHPRSARVGGPSPSGLTLELPGTCSASPALGNSCVSPRILSPPPIGVSLWTNNVAAPQPRNPRIASPSFSSDGSLFPPFSSSPSRSESCPPAAPVLRRSFSSTLADRPSSPVRSPSGGLRRSWADSGRRSYGLTGSSRAPFDQQDPSDGASVSGLPSCLSPRAGLQSAPSPSRFTPQRGILGGQHFPVVPWSDVQELSSKRSGTEQLERSSPTTTTAVPSASSPQTPASPAPSDGEWGDPELEEGSCRSQLICAYVARPPPEHSPLFSSSGMTSPAPVHQTGGVQRPPQVHMTPRSPSSPPRSGTLPTVTKQGNQRASYATTVNLQIAGSGRITSYSSAQVSLTQTLQGGAGSGGPAPGQFIRRVSINGLLPGPQS